MQRLEISYEVVDEITPELFDMAKKRVAEKKEKKLKKNMKAAAATDATKFMALIIHQLDTELN